MNAMTRAHKRAMQKSGAVLRSTALQRFLYGPMIAFGFRVPQGGALGDSYAPYANMYQDEEMLFGLAEVLVIVAILEEALTAIIHTDKCCNVHSSCSILSRHPKIAPYCHP